MIEIILCLSVIVNLALMWYGFLLLKKVIYVSGNTSEIIDAVEGFRTHLDGVYELELFYGDETLKFLMSHTNSLLGILKEYEDVYEIAGTLELQGEIKIDREENNEEDSEEGTTEEEGSPEINKENVFYTGS